MLLFFSFTVIRTSRPRLAAKVTPSPQPGLGAFKGTLGDPVAKIGADQVAGNSNLKLGDTGTPGGWFQKVEFVYSIYHPSGGDIKYTKSLYYWDLNQATERSAQIHRTRRKTHAKCCGHEARRGAAVVMPSPPRRMSPGAAPAPRPTQQRTGGSSHGNVVGVRITERIPPRVAPAAAVESVTV